MDFNYTDEQRMLSDVLERYLAEQYDSATRQKIAYDDIGSSSRHWKELAELGVIGALFPEDAGGFSGNAFDVQVVFDSIGHWLVTEPFLDTLMVGRALMAAGDTTRLGSLIDGTSVAVVAHQEPDSHYEPTQVCTHATKIDRGWTLNGAKTVVHNAARTDFFLISARTHGTDNTADGIALFIVPRDAAGLSVRNYPRIDGGSAGELSLSNVPLDDHAVLGKADTGAAILADATAWGLLALCAEAVGAMSIARRDTVEYLRTRKQFGVPIGSFQALQHRMVDLMIDIEQARSAVTNAAAAMTHDALMRDRALAAAKYTIGHTGTHVAEECIQMHGGIGMTWELPLSHYAKRLVMIDHELGDEDHHLQRFIKLSRHASATNAPRASYATVRT